MKKSEVVDQPTLKNYCAAQVKEFNKLHDEFVDMFQQILQRKTYKDFARKMQDKKREIDDVSDIIANSQNLIFSSDDLQKNIKKIDSLVGSAKRMHKEIKEYYQRDGENDQKIIAEITDRIATHYKKFTDEWRGTVKQALAQKNYMAAAELIVTIPYYSPYVGAATGERTQISFAGAYALGEKNQEINKWVEETKEALPPAALLQAKINHLTNLLPELYKEIAEVAGELATTMENGARRDQVGLISSYEEKRRIESLIEEISKRNNTRESKISSLENAKNELEALGEKTQSNNYERD